MYQTQKQEINQEALAQQQQAFILNQKMQKYLGMVNSAYGQQGLNPSDAVYLGNQYQNNLGAIQSTKQQQTSDLYKTQAATNFQNLQTENQRAYEQQLTADQRMYQGAMVQDERQYNTDMAVLQNAQSSLEGYFGQLLGNIPANQKVNSGQIRQELMKYMNTLGIPKENRKYIETYIEALSQSASYGYQETE